MNRSVLCADIGTTSLKTAVIRGSGEVVSFSQQFFPLRDEAHAALAWLPALVRAAAEMNSSSVDALCISGNGPTVVSPDGRTLLWNTLADTRSTDGTTAAQSLFVPRIAVFLRQYPDVAAEKQTVLSGPEFLIWQLTGTAVTILPEERYRTAYWTDEQLAAAHIAGTQLAPYVPVAANAGMTTAAATEQLGLARPVPVFCGGPDFIAAMTGTNSFTAGKWYDCAGSSEGLNLCTEHPLDRTDSGKKNRSSIRLLPSLIPGLWNAAVLETESGRMFENYRQIYEAIAGHTVSYRTLIDACLDNTDSDGYGVLASIADNFRRMVQTLRDAARANGIIPAPYITVTGGQAKNDRWMQMKCNSAGIPLAVCNCADAELIGDAVIAQTGLGAYRSVREAADALIKTTQLYEPEGRA